MSTSITLRPANSDDVAVLQKILFEAIAWDPARQLPPMEQLVAHPELARYHAGWGRPGDLAVLALDGSDVVGGILCRLFTADDHGHGFLDEQTPELAVAVWSEHRGRGIGTMLFEALEDAARGEGIARLSLSVDSGNPAVRLYERLGYERVSEDDEGIRMVKAV